MEVEPVLLAERDLSSADSLVSRNDPDEINNEQTWPEDEEMTGMEATLTGADALPDARYGTTPKSIKRIPKGMSEYQAAWIIESGSEGDESGDEVDERGHEENDDGEMNQLEAEDLKGLQLTDEQEETAMDRDASFLEFDAEEEAKQYVALRPVQLLFMLIIYRLEAWKKREREEENDLTFPDEIDTPKDSLARTRFQRYRGMRSFRTSPWDPYENLPKDYSQIFQFEDFKRTERGVRRRANQELDSVEVGASD
jgi:pre-rRNA-processing protein TSR1